MLALMPVSGDVDLVVAAELIEAGRAVVRGIVTPERTTVVASTHRIYGITEKSAMGDGIVDGNAVFAALHARSKRFISFDMQALAEEHRSVISSTLFGAIAASGVLPFPRALYEQAITQSGVAVQSSLAAFAAGFERALQRSPMTSLVPPGAAPTTELGRKLDARIKAEFPAHLHGLLQEGVRRCVDYQDGEYANLYLDRMHEIRDCDQRTQGAGGGYALTAAVARHLALWMSYEDTIRVADLKTRRTRFNRVREEVRAQAEQIVYMSEFMHPRFDEVCETLPARLGARLHASSRARRLFAPLFRKGRQIETAHIGGFLLLYAVSGLRRWRRGTLRYRLEQGAHRCMAGARQGARNETRRLRRRGRARGVSTPGEGIQRYARARTEELRRHRRRDPALWRSTGSRGNHQAPAHCGPGGRGRQATTGGGQRAGAVCYLSSDTYICSTLPGPSSTTVIAPSPLKCARGRSGRCTNTTTNRATPSMQACRRLVADLGAAGFTRRCVPRAYGGTSEDFDARAICLVRETLAEYDGLADFAFAMQGLGSGAISIAGSDALRARYLPEVAAGRAIAAFALSEPDAGSDVAAMQCSARRDGDHYVLDGAKTWISNGGIADFYCVFARTTPGQKRADGTTGAQGITAFVVDADAPGFEIEQRIDVIAPHPLATLRFRNCRVSEAQRIGAEGEGFKIAMRTLDVFRTSVAAAALGFARRALREALAHVRKRAMFGKTLADLQLTQAGFADMATEVDAAALLVYRAAWLRDLGNVVTKEAAMAKLAATEGCATSDRSRRADVRRARSTQRRGGRAPVS